MSAKSPTPDCRSASGASVWQRLRLAAFFVIVAILAARPLMSETFEHLSVSFIAATDSGPTPATTLWMDALLLAASAIALSRIERWTRAMRIVAAGLGLLLVAVIVSSCLADNKRLALNAGVSFWIGLVSAAALVRLMSARRMVSILVAAMLASGAATAFKCMKWHWSEFDQTRRDWETQKQALIDQGVDVESGIIENFQRRLGSGESSGYLSHPNIAGSVLMMWWLPAAGLLIAWLSRLLRRRDREAAEGVIFLTILCGALAVSLWLTGSRGAFVACGAGGVILCALAWARRFVARRPAVVLTLLAGGYVAVIAAATTYGVSKGTLPNSSLAFRWNYWTAAAKTIREAPLAGIGRENFVAAYMRHKPAESPEEVHNPHNLWVTAQTELGVCGLLAIGLLSLTWAYSALQSPMSNGAPDQPGGEIATAHLIVPIVAFCILHGAFSRMGLSNLYILLRYWLIEIVLIWVGTFVFAARIIHACPAHDRWLRAGLIAAVFGELVHSLVGFAMFTPAGLGVTAALAAAAVCSARFGVSTAPVDRRATAVAARRRLSVYGTTILAVIAVVAHLWLIDFPTTRSETVMTRLRRVATRSGGANRAASLIGATEEAVGGDAWNSSSLRELAEIMSRRIVPSADLPPVQREPLLLRARAIAVRAAERSPATMSNWNLLANISEQLGGWFRSLGRNDEAISALRDAIRFRRESVKLYPTSARLRMGLASALFLLWNETGEPDARLASANQYRAALELNSRLNEIEVMRLRQSKLEFIRARLQQLEAEP